MDEKKIHQLQLKNVSYKYGKDAKAKQILQHTNYTFESGKMYAILGKSGVGKSTTLSLLGAIDYPQEGEIIFDGRDIRLIGYENYRKNIVSIIFQDYNLLSYLNGYENIKLVMGKNSDKNKIDNFLKNVGIDSDTALRNVKKLSGGEQQRIAIARAFAMDSKIILADEPTGNLDLETSEEIINILLKMAHEEGKCVIAVTHTLELARKADIALEFKEGRVYEFEGKW